MQTRNHGPLYGRERELARLALGVDRVVAGRGECLLVTGELGVGTSALADRACDLADARGVTVLRGRAWPLHGGVAYGPIMAAVGAVLRAVEPAHRDALTEGLDELGRLFPWLALRPPAGSHDELDTGRLWESFVALLDRLTREAPVLLCLDDVHAADDATLELLQYVIHAVPSMPLWVVLTLHGSAASQKLRLMVTLLEQAALAATLTPEPLDRGHTRALIETR